MITIKRNPHVITVTVPLPCKASDLERVLHSMCDGHGCWPTTVVTATETELTLTHTENKPERSTK